MTIRTVPMRGLDKRQRGRWIRTCKAETIRMGINVLQIRNIYNRDDHGKIFHL